METDMTFKEMNQFVLKGGQIIVHMHGKLFEVYLTPKNQSKRTNVYGTTMKKALDKAYKLYKSYK